MTKYINKTGKSLCGRVQKPPFHQVFPNPKVITELGPSLMYLLQMSGLYCGISVDHGYYLVTCNKGESARCKRGSLSVKEVGS
jgi:hypothetical protein